MAFKNQVCVTYVHDVSKKQKHFLLVPFIPNTLHTDACLTNVYNQ